VLLENNSEYRDSHPPNKTGANSASKALIHGRVICVAADIAMPSGHTCSHVQVKQTMARIKQVLTERAYAEPTPEKRAAALAKINAK
jgi:hypothetical protein